VSSVAIVPADAAIEELLDAHADFSPVPLCPQVHAFHARSLVGIWEAAETLAGEPLGAPFWAWPWAAGQALARVVLDAPQRVRGLRVLDFGAGGGVAAFACAVAGARQVIANDVDPWALAVTRIAARRQGLDIETLGADLTADPTAVRAFDVLLCGDLGYDRSATPRERAVLDAARAAGVRVLAGDAGRTYFDATDLIPVASFDVHVPHDLEGRDRRVTRIFEG
jgi:predicted nicotinamide N-methyase